MAFVLLITLIVASLFAARAGRRPGPDQARMRWLGLALAVAALATSLWIVSRAAADHRGADGAVQSAPPLP